MLSLIIGRRSDRKARYVQLEDSKDSKDSKDSENYGEQPFGGERRCNFRLDRCRSPFPLLGLPLRPFESFESSC